MCSKCDELDRKIEHYQRLSRMLLDERVIEGLETLIEVQGRKKWASSRKPGRRFELTPVKARQDFRAHTFIITARSVASIGDENARCAPAHSNRGAAPCSDAVSRL